MNYTPKSSRVLCRGLRGDLLPVLLAGEAAQPGQGAAFVVLAAHFHDLPSTSADKCF